MQDKGGKNIRGRNVDVDISATKFDGDWYECAMSIEVRRHTTIMDIATLLDKGELAF